MGSEAGMTFRVVWNCNKEALYSSINSLTMGHPQREAPPSGRRQCPAMSHQQPTLPADRGMRTLVLRDVWWCPTASPVRMKFKLLVVTQETLMAWVLPTLISYTPFFLWVCVFLNTDSLLPPPRLYTQYPFYYKKVFIFGWAGSLVSCGLSLVVTGAATLLWCAGFSLQWLLLWWSMSSRHMGFCSCNTQTLECGSQ